MRRDRERAIAATLLVGTGAFQTALTAGAPWGAAAWGGAHSGTLPPGLRVASGAAAALYGGMAWLVLRRPLAPKAQTRVQQGLAVLFAAGIVMNLASPSPPERVWAVVCAALAITVWRSR